MPKKPPHAQPLPDVLQLLLKRLRRNSNVRYTEDDHLYRLLWRQMLIERLDKFEALQKLIEQRNSSKQRKARSIESQ